VTGERTLGNCAPNRAWVLSRSHSETACCIFNHQHSQKYIWKDFWGPQTEYILPNLVPTLLEQKLPGTFLGLLKALVDDHYR
jgi:hypothetical protein